LRCALPAAYRSFIVLGRPLSLEIVVIGDLTGLLFYGSLGALDFPLISFLFVVPSLGGRIEEGWCRRVEKVGGVGG
jgi:hypothetical protein